MSIIKFVVSIFLFSFCVLLCACAGSPSNPTQSSSAGNSGVQIRETSSQTITTMETIRINNCGGKADSKQTAERSFTVNIEGTVGASVGYAVVQANVSAKYSQYRSVTKKQELTAPPATNMEFVLKWTELEWVGSIISNGQSGSYNAHSPIAVEQVSGKDRADCGTTQLPTAVPPQAPVVIATTRAPIPTAIVVVPTSRPTGNAIIGALTNSGVVDSDAGTIGLYRRRILDATGKLIGTYDDTIWENPKRGTGLAEFYDLEPGVYIVCLSQYGTWIKVGEITIVPSTTVRQNFRWPVGVQMGSRCDLR